MPALALLEDIRLEIQHDAPWLYGIRSAPGSTATEPADGKALVSNHGWRGDHRTAQLPRSPRQLPGPQHENEAVTRAFQGSKEEL